MFIVSSPFSFVKGGLIEHLKHKRRGCDCKIIFKTRRDAKNRKGHKNGGMGNVRKGKNGLVFQILKG